MFFVRRRTDASGFVGLVEAAALVLLAVVQGGVLCFCAPREGGHSHVCSPEAAVAAFPTDVSGTSCSANEADGSRLVAAPCDHLRVGALDWFLSCGSLSVSLPFAFPASARLQGVTQGAWSFRDVPRAASPPDAFLLFRVRAHARS